MYAIVAFAGKQYQLETGKSFSIESTSEISQVEAGNSFNLEKVLFINKDGAIQTGQPIISGAKVTVKVLEHFKGKKIRVETYKRRKGKKRTLGHRQPLVKIQVEAIQA